MAKQESTRIHVKKIANRKTRKKRQHKKERTTVNKHSMATKEMQKQIRKHNRK